MSAFRSSAVVILGDVCFLLFFLQYDTVFNCILVFAAPEAFSLKKFEAPETKRRRMPNRYDNMKRLICNERILRYEMNDVLKSGF